MVSAAKNLGAEQFRITAEGTPKTYRIYMQCPVEVTECGANIAEGRKIDAGVKTSVGEILEGTLFKMISDAFLANKAAMEDPNLPSGLRPIRGSLRSDSLSKLEQIEVAALKARYIAHLAEQQGADNIPEVGTPPPGIIPTSIALKAKERLIKATEMMLSSGKLIGQDDVCHVSVSTLFQIDRVEREKES